MTEPKAEEMDDDVAAWMAEVSSAREIFHDCTEGDDPPGDAIHVVAGLADQLEASTQEVARLRRILKRAAEPTFGDFRREPSGMLALSIKDPMRVGITICQMLANMLDHVGAPNYIATQFHGAEGVGNIEVEVIRYGKLSPNKARHEAEAHLARAVALLAEHGIAWDGPTTFKPDTPVELPRDEDDPASWLRLVPGDDGAPAALLCTRCNGKQELPREHTHDVLMAMGKAFEDRHDSCKEGDALAGKAPAEGQR